LLINDIIYRYNSASSKFVKDTTSLGSQTQLSCVDDFTYCIAGSDKNIYFYNSSTSKYDAKTNIPSLKSNIKMIVKKNVLSSNPTTTTDSLIIISWQAQASASKVHDYIIHVFKVITKTTTTTTSPPAVIYTYTFSEITNQIFFGTFYDAITPSINGPTVLISPSFKNIIAYGKDTVSTYYSFGGYMDY